MIVVFDKEYLRDLYVTGKTDDKKHRYQPEIVRKYRFCIKTIEGIARIEDLFAFNSFHYETLKGDKKGISSIRVNNQYRIEFTVKKESLEPVITVCNILDLSNHYN